MIDYCDSYISNVEYFHTEHFMMLGNRQDVGVLNGNVSALANLANIF